MLAGQRLRLAATALSAAGDARDDAIAWTSSNRAASRASPTASSPPSRRDRRHHGARRRAGARRGDDRRFRSIPSAGVTATITPERARARQGDVVRFALTVKDARGQTITGLTPAWSFSPGQGTIDEDGAFVGNVPGTYVVTRVARRADASTRP